MLALFRHTQVHEWSPGEHVHLVQAGAGRWARLTAFLIGGTIAAVVSYLGLSSTEQGGPVAVSGACFLVFGWAFALAVKTVAPGRELIIDWSEQSMIASVGRCSRTIAFSDIECLEAQVVETREYDANQNKVAQFYGELFAVGPAGRISLLRGDRAASTADRAGDRIREVAEQLSSPLDIAWHEAPPVRRSMLDGAWRQMSALDRLFALALPAGGVASLVWWLVK